MKMKWATTSLPVWTSGRRPRATSRLSRTIAITKRIEEAQLVLFVCPPLARKPESKTAKQPKDSPMVKTDSQPIGKGILLPSGADVNYVPSVPVSQPLQARVAFRSIVRLAGGVGLAVFRVSPSDLVGNCIILHFWLGLSWCSWGRQWYAWMGGSDLGDVGNQRAIEAMLQSVVTRIAGNGHDEPILNAVPNVLGTRTGSFGSTKPKCRSGIPLHPCSHFMCNGMLTSCPASWKLLVLEGGKVYPVA